MPADSFESPLTLAACGGHVELAELLIERGANIEEVRKHEISVKLLEHFSYMNMEQSRCLLSCVLTKVICKLAIMY